MRFSSNTLVVAASALLISSAPLIAEETRTVPRADADYTAQRSDPINHDVDLMITVTPPYHCKVLKVWVPVPQSDFAQQVGESRFRTFPQKIEPQIDTEKVYGNRFAYFEFHNPRGAQIIRQQFSATVWNLHWDVDPQSVAHAEQWPDEFDRYLRLQSLEDEQDFQKMLRKIVPRSKGGTADMQLVMQWINDNLKYDHTDASLKADADHALSLRRGHCSDYHGLCSTMGRALGHPSRVTYGLALYPKNSPSHCKMESYLPPYGWVSFDLSETQKLVKKINEDGTLSSAEKTALAAEARARLLGGFRENSWLLLTKGTDYELAPQAANKVRIVRTAYVEADGEALPEPDPANINKREFAWMTAHKYEADKPITFPFMDYATLKVESGEPKAED